MSSGELYVYDVPDVRMYISCIYIILFFLLQNVFIDILKQVDPNVCR